MVWNNLKQYRSVTMYGLLLAVLLFFLKWIEWRFIIVEHTFEVYAGVIALLFTLLGIWLAIKLTKPKIVIVEKHIYSPSTNGFVINEKEILQLGLSTRELEVLQLMATGLSNRQIADKLFISVNTIKTHSAKLFEKMDVQRRTQAIEKARRLGLIP
ncbi:response regulator transcription factor [Mucilaginibacter segetis]|uniref:Response regulator transcription factor n=1 Tax=Mucilaginibacter segetis TaxID=2793071 RepID=A0A934PS00_9SPHI|nr:LuxR C-terminal-related transcriptional regulator [Mucilaginibacter segetis]MBK0379019.1 response regulator transcription factor [Mucilaginibacter segetis]